MAKKTIDGKIYCTFTIDETVKQRFGIACSALDISMSPTVEALIENFLDISKKQVDDALDKKMNFNKAEASVEFVNSVIHSKDGE